jgi:prophage regulatory protein
MDAPANTPRRILPQRQVTERTSLAKASIYREVKAGRFPAPLELTGGRVGWYADEIDQWIDGRARRVLSPLSAAETA